MSDGVILLGSVSEINHENWQGYAGCYDCFTSLQIYKDFWKSTLRGLLPKPGGIVVDLGCGQGGGFEEIIKRVQPGLIIGVDYSSEMLKMAEQEAYRLMKKHSGVTISTVNRDICKKSLRDFGKVDAVIAHLVSYYLSAERWQNFILPEIFGILNTDGYLLSTDATSEFDFRRDISGWQFFVELALHPMAMKKLKEQGKPWLVKIQSTVGHRYPTYEDRLEMLKSVNARDIQTISWVLNKKFVTLRAHK